MNGAFKLGHRRAVRQEMREAAAAALFFFTRYLQALGNVEPDAAVYREHFERFEKRANEKRAELTPRQDVPAPDEPAASQ